MNKQQIAISEGRRVVGGNLRKVSWAKLADSCCTSFVIAFRFHRSVKKVKVVGVLILNWRVDSMSLSDDSSSSIQILVPAVQYFQTFLANDDSSYFVASIKLAMVYFFRLWLERKLLLWISLQNLMRKRQDAMKHWKICMLPGFDTATQRFETEHKNWADEPSLWKHHLLPHGRVAATTPEGRPPDDPSLLKIDRRGLIAMDANFVTEKKLSSNYIHIKIECIYLRTKKTNKSSDCIFGKLDSRKYEYYS